MNSFFESPSPHKEAAEFLRGKIVLGRREFLGLPPAIRAKAITVAKVENLYTIQRIRDACAAVPEGGDWGTSKQEIAAELLPYMDSADDDFLLPLGDDEKAQAQAESRAELILRMNVGQSYAASYTKALDAHQDVFPYRQYLTMGDSLVRDDHAALDNLILPSDHPFWDDHTPPWDFNCRCSFAGVMGDEAEEIAAAEEENGTPPEQRTVLDDVALDRLQKTGKLLRGNNLVDLRTDHDKRGPKGYEWNPRDLNLPRDAVLDKLDADLRQDFEDWAKSEIVPELKISIWEWMR